MTQLVGPRLSRLAMRAGTAVGAVGLAAVALTPVEAPQAGALTTSYAYVTNASSPGSVSVINTSTNTVVKTVTFGVGKDPDGVAITPNGSDAYVANSFSRSVSVINTATNKVAAVVPVENYPDAVAITPNGSDAYVANGGNTVSVINTSTNKVVKTVGVGNGPDAVAITPN